MNLTQFLERWPAKEGRLFLFAGGRDHDRLSMFYSVADRWKKKVNPLVDFVRLHEPSYAEIAEACRRDPVDSKQVVVVATEVQWLDPNDHKDDRGVAALTSIVENFPRDLVLIISIHQSEQNPLTKNPLAQAIIRKGYWVVLKPVDEAGACELVKSMTGWEDEIVQEIVYAVGTIPADLISLLKLLKLAGAEEPDQIRKYLSGRQEGTVFDLTEAIVMRDPVKALALASDDINTNQLVGALDRKFTSLLQFIAEMKKGGRSPKEAALALRLPGFIVHGLYEASKRWSPNDIIQVFSVLADVSKESNRPGVNDLLVQRLAV